MHHSITHSWRLFWILVAFFLCTVSGHFYSPDEEAMFLVSKAMVDRQSIDIAPYPEYLTSIRVDGVDGGKYASYGILPSLYAAPVYAIAARATPENELAQYDLSHLLITLINIPFAAGIGVLLVHLLVMAGISQRTATIMALSCVLGLLAPYVRTFFSEVIATFWLLASTYAFMRAQTHPPHARTRLWWLAAAGFALSMLVNTRVVSGVVAPIFVVALAVWHPKRDLWRDIAAWGAGGIPGFILFAWYNVARFGTMFATGYGTQHDQAFDTVIWDGLYGLLISLPRGIIWYFPMVLLLPIGAWMLHRQRAHRELALYMALILVHLIVYARVWFWDGGGVWGPRYLVITTPFIILISAHVAVSAQQWLRWVAYVAVGLTITINSLGAMVNFATYTNMAEAHPSPIVAHAQLLRTRIAQAWPAEQTCYLRTGWYDREQADQALYRRSESEATIECTITQPTVLKLTIDDRRPATAPASDAYIHLNDEAYAIRVGTQHTIEWLARIPDNRIMITSIPWNPRSVGFGNRNEDIGPTLLYLRSGVSDIHINDTNIMGMSEIYALRWTWYYAPLNQHLLDWWPLYLPYTALSPYARTLLMLWGIGVVACVVIAALPIPAWVHALYRRTKTDPREQGSVS